MSVCVIDPGGPGVSGKSSSPKFSSANSSKLVLLIDKVLENAQRSGRLDLSSRNLKTFPKSACKFKLTDTFVSDLSRNKLTELPQECTEYYWMERLVLYHNMIRSIPDSVSCLHSLKFLDLSRNQLSYLPDTLCQLPSLEVLIVNNNRLVSLPEEIGKMQSLNQLDASCNEITHLPVQIGDMTSLRSLNLRRNHLQEVPVEISFLRLVHMDLSANRITTLPVELRFMNSVVELSLGENPLSCPPANLCSRGKVHVFKHLEIQAIKEDRKRGVLTDSEYRRSYRHKTTAGQLNDFRFANGFGADARRKRHTADSGYGSEQPLDRRWSQDFSQDAVDMHTEDARRIILRAANAGPRSPQKGGRGQSGGSQAPHIINIAGSRTSASAATSVSTSPPTTNIALATIHQLQGHTNATGPPPPLNSNGSSGSSSGHSSMSGCVAVPPISSSSSYDITVDASSNPNLRLISSSSPSPPSSSATSSPSSRISNPQQNVYFQPQHAPMPGCEGAITKPNGQYLNFYNNKATVIQNGHKMLYKDSSKATEVSTNGNDAGQLLLMTSSDEKSTIKPGLNCSSGLVSTTSGSIRVDNKETSDDVEKEERRKIASKLLGKQGIPGTLSSSTKASSNSKSQPPSRAHPGNNSLRHAQPLLPPPQGYHTIPSPQATIPASTAKPGHTSPTNNSPSSLLPVPVSSFNVGSCLQQKTQIYSHRQIKDQLRRQNLTAGRNIPSPTSTSGNIPIKIEHQQPHNSEVHSGQKGKVNTLSIDDPQHPEKNSHNSHSNAVAHTMQITSQNSSSNSRLIHSSSSSSSSTYSVASSATNASTVRLQTSSSTSTSSSSLAGGSADSGNGVPNKKTSSYDVKAFQKEAVLSYVKAKQSSPAHSVASLHPQDSLDGSSGVVGHRSASPRLSSASTSRSAQQLAHGVSSLITSHKNALAQNNINNQISNSNIPLLSHTNGLKQSIVKVSSTTNSFGHGKSVDSNGPSRQYVARREIDNSTSADSHISQLKMHIESRLRISLPDNLSTALADGVILCHVANHVRPRAVPSIHVPSPAVPKLNTAKCRRNVENFLLACKRIGVREDLICSPLDLLEPRKQGTVRVAITVSELLRFYQAKPAANPSVGMTTHLSSGHHVTISSGVHL